MAKFNASGLPSEFLTIVRQIEAEVQEKEGLVAKEKQLLKGNEKEIAEKTEAIKSQQEKNAELERSIQHLDCLYQNQMRHLESAREAGELLKEQARNKQEEYELLIERNQIMKDSCEAKYQEYARKFNERMNFYETLPLVPEYKREMEKIIELQKIIKEKRNKESKIRKELQILQDKRDAVKPAFSSITEWGVTVAKLALQAQQSNIPECKAKVECLKVEVDQLENQKQEIFEKQEKAKRETEEKLAVPVPKTSVSECVNPGKSVSLTSLPPIPRLPSPFKPPLAPNFRSFFMQRFANPEKNVTGTSGSSMRGHLSSSSLPNIASLFVDKPKAVPFKAPKLQFTPSNISTGDASKTTSLKQLLPTIEEHQAYKLQRSQSLTMLLPQVKPIQKTASAITTPSKSGRSLADWLTSCPKKSNQDAAEADGMVVSDNEAAKIKQEQKKVSTEKTQIKSGRASWPFSASQSTRITEVPLLRQVQERMLHQKRNTDQETNKPVASSDVAGTSSSREVDTNEDDAGTSVDQPTQETIPGYFDGPVYDVPMPTMEEELAKATEQAQKAKLTRSPPMPGTPTYSSSLEEYEQMMAEIQKSPEDAQFQFESRIMFSESGENSFLMSGSPTHSKHPTKKNPPIPGVSEPEEFKFVVPIGPPPGRKQKSPNTLMPFSFNGNQPTSPEETAPSPFSGFGFGGVSDTSTPPSGFSFNVSETQPSSESESFSFMFGASEPASPPETTNIFSFGASSPTSQETSGNSFTNFHVDGGGDASSSSFSSIFGCKK